MSLCQKKSSALLTEHSIFSNVIHVIPHSTSKNRALLSCKDWVALSGIGCEVNGDLIWFWIGSHAEYDRMLKGQ